MSTPANPFSADYQPDPRRWKALAVCLVVGFMTLLDVSIVNVALPSIEAGLGASTADLSWVVSGYALAYGLVLVPAGRVGDARGRKTTFLVGLTLFVLASTACGLAQGPTQLVVSRLIQGVAGGILAPQVSGLIQLLFRGAERGRAFGMFAATIGISTAVGPLLGGVLIQAGGTAEGWRWIFFVNVPIGIVAFIAAIRLIPARPSELKQPLRGSFDPMGVLLLGAGVFALMLPMVQDQEWPGARKWLLLVVGAIVLGAFVLWERRQGRAGRQQLIDLSLFSLRSYTLGCIIAMVYFAGFTTVFFIYTLFVQQGLGYTALQAGLAVTPFALGSAVSASIGGNIVGKVGRKLVLIGLGLVVLGMVATIIAVQFVPGHSVGYAAAVPLLVAGIGSGLVISPNLTLSLDPVPVTKAGIAGGILQTGQRIGAAAGIALVGAVFFAQVANSHGDWARAFQIGLATAGFLVLIALAVGLADYLPHRRETVGAR
ncbi:DHA2 family efflux MFS transporter permease subunit [Gordonia jinghuaiqii]|uniref:MFS transporter n=1 Tax=Gordonia jinghuaiqii TaxID=2758710 RepID=A0A7D7QZM1_9ACTN|nr:MFS transporter [Gordonia jinghuaiqii]MCR5978695.1 DHA2 family efflux MFS transporter permease subunit [Gordonia jinghuaiqii]QMT03009.1 MFS transporter [Gordonia jinghuaiqii]